MPFNLSYPCSESMALVLDNKRMPSHVESIGVVHCQYELIKQPDHYQLKLMTQCELTLCCQRCMDSFNYEYQNKTEIGLCDSDKIAEKIMESLDPVVLKGATIPFETLILDELHLYLPLFHQHENLCKLSEYFVYKLCNK